MPPLFSSIPYLPKKNPICEYAQPLPEWEDYILKLLPGFVVAITDMPCLFVPPIATVIEMSRCQVTGNLYIQYEREPVLVSWRGKVMDMVDQI